MMKTSSNERMTAAEAAEYLGIKEQTLAVWRTTGRYRLPFIKVGRCVKYAKADLDAFLDRNRATRTDSGHESVVPDDQL